MNSKLLVKVVRYGHVQSTRQIETVARSASIQIDERVRADDYDSYKQHPGKNVLKKIQLPEHLEERINKVVSEFNTSNLVQEAFRFKQMLFDRRCPMEKNEIEKLKRSAVKEFGRAAHVNRENVEEKLIWQEEVQGEVEHRVKSQVREWSPIEYNLRHGLLYLAARFATDYSVLKQIFNEIRRKNPSFQPKNVFDFGSGVGTTMWAAESVWEEAKLAEFLNVDMSSYMNHLSELIIRNGSLDKPAYFKQFYFKRNYPRSERGQFDLVVCSFSLLEMNNRQARFEILESLWHKLKTGGYLVITENGTKHGFKIISEAREFFREKFEQPSNEDQGHIFLPCPHQQVCPLVKLGKPESCRFFVTYQPLSLYDHKGNKSSKENFPYSYLVLSKSDKPHGLTNWPRLVYKEPFKPTSGVYKSWICQQDGQLEHLIATKARNKILMNLVKYSNLGDELPISISKNQDKE